MLGARDRVVRVQSARLRAQQVPVSGSRMYQMLLFDFSPRGTYSFDPSSVTAS